MRLKSIFYDGYGFARAIIINNKGVEYDTCLDPTMRDTHCTCADAVYRKNQKCKHIIFLMGKVKMEKMKKNMNETKIKSECEKIDDLLGGGIQQGAITGIVGKRMVGKSMFSYQVGLANLKQTKKKTLLIDTEGTPIYDVRVLQYRFGKRFDLKPEEINERFVMKTTIGDAKYKNLVKLLRMLGLEVRITQSDRGKMTPIFKPCSAELDDTELKKYSMIILDSMTTPMETFVTETTSNLPTRSQIEARLFGILTHIAKLYNIGVIVTFHTTYNPAAIGYTDHGKPKGGDVIVYNTKYILQFDDAINKEKKDNFGSETKRAKLYRHPIKIPGNKWDLIRLKEDYGYTDK